jgi:hypothetical protein
MANDKKTIGLTRDNRDVVAGLIDSGVFDDQMDAAKFAMSFAIKNGEELGELEGAETIWNVGSFDSDGQVALLLPLLFAGLEAPYRAAEYFVNRGLVLIANEIASGSDVGEIIESCGQ